MSEKLTAAELKEKICSTSKNGILRVEESVVDASDAFCENYKKFLDDGKTEREAVKATVKLAKENGFTEFDDTKKYNPGDRVYYVNRRKSVILCVFGKDSVANGVKIAAAHVDSPRLDLKQHPLYEDNELCLFKTHYYGGIKKYQWAAIPLSLHGVVITSKGEKVEVRIGEDAGDPVFCVTDLLPHLAQDQMKRSAGEIIKGEELNILIGSRPFRDDEASERVKLNIMAIINKKYNIVEDDFISAELEVVPAFKASDVGFDRSMIGAYGQDDRVCAYTALMAIFECKVPNKTCITVLTDKEEIGSVGNTGLHSSYLKHFIYDLAKHDGVDGYKVLSASECLSADVNAAFDPTFPDVLERRNASYLNYGVCVTKFTGSRGKSGTSDAGAEFVGRVRNLLDKNNVVWQTGELGRVDLGGGGTVAQYVAYLNVDVIDVGVPVISMHAPFEITSKFDVYMTYKAFDAFFAE